MSASAPVEELIPASLADLFYMTRLRDPIDSGWLPNLTGLPTQEKVALITQSVNKLIMQETDKKCTSIDPNLRKMMFQHFLIYQQMANAQGIYLDETITHQWAHILAMILKESSGDSTSITDMSGHSISTYEPATNLEQWQKILNLSKDDRIRMNKQTNFGLTQISPDRLFSVFNFYKNQVYFTSFLEGKKGASTPVKVRLNTAIAIRRLVWLYQDFAQGRFLESDMRIRRRDIYKPQFYERYQAGLNMALLYCGTRFMFHEESQTDSIKLKDAMASIAYCKLGNAQTGYGLNEIEDKCFAAWITMCPTLNIDIAALIPISYFATRHEAPVCENTFNRILNKKPGSSNVH